MAGGRKRQKREVKQVVLKPPLEILPIEMWEHTFNHLPATDVITCTHTSQAWREFYRPKRTSLLMEVAFSPLSKYLSNADILNSRKVCRHWRNGVDASLQNHPVHYDIRFDDNTERVATPPTLDIANCFSPANMLKFERVAEDLGEGSVNPFLITRHLSYVEYDTQDPRHNRGHFITQRAVLFKLLIRFGSHLWHCCLILEEMDSQTRLYKWVRSMLVWMPNLKTLSIFFAGSARISQLVLAPSLQDLVRDEPFPELNHLVKFCCEVDSVIEFGALQRFTNLRKVYCVNGLRSFQLPAHNQRLNDLRELHANLIGPDDIQKLKVICPLKVLKLNVKTSTLDLDVLFRSVSHFPLQHFDLHLTKKDYGELPPIREMLEFPELQTLKIVAGDNHFKNLDCVLKCTSLKRLQIQMKVSAGSNRFRRRAAVGTLQFLGYEDSMYQSNIWELLPKLEKLQVTTRTLVSARAPKEMKYNYHRYYYNRAIKN